MTPRAAPSRPRARETRGVLTVATLRAGGVPAARVVATHDVRREPGVELIASSLDDVLECVRAWWDEHWSPGAGDDDARRDRPRRG